MNNSVVYYSDILDLYTDSGGNPVSGLFYHVGLGLDQYTGPYGVEDGRWYTYSNGVRGDAYNGLLFYDVDLWSSSFFNNTWRVVQDGYTAFLYNGVIQGTDGMWYNALNNPPDTFANGFKVNLDNVWYYYDHGVRGSLLQGVSFANESTWSYYIDGIDSGPASGTYLFADDSLWHSYITGSDAGPADYILKSLLDNKWHQYSSGTDLGLVDGIYISYVDSYKWHKYVSGVDLGKLSGVYKNIHTSDNLWYLFQDGAASSLATRVYLKPDENKWYNFLNGVASSLFTGSLLVDGVYIQVYFGVAAAVSGISTLTNDTVNPAGTYYHWYNNNQINIVEGIIFDILADSKWHNYVTGIDQGVYTFVPTQRYALDVQLEGLTLTESTSKPPKVKLNNVNFGSSDFTIEFTFYRYYGSSTTPTNILTLIDKDNISQHINIYSILYSMYITLNGTTIRVDSQYVSRWNKVIIARKSDLIYIMFNGTCIKTIQETSITNFTAMETYVGALPSTFASTSVSSYCSRVNKFKITDLRIIEGQALYVDDLLYYFYRNFTFEFWIMPSSIGPITNSNYTTRIRAFNIQLELYPNMKLVLSHIFNGSTWEVVTPTTDLQLNYSSPTEISPQWSHVAVTYSNNTLKMYINGTLTHSQAITPVQILNVIDAPLGYYYAYPESPLFPNLQITQQQHPTGNTSEAEAENHTPVTLTNVRYIANQNIYSAGVTVPTGPLSEEGFYNVSANTTVLQNITGTVLYIRCNNNNSNDFYDEKFDSTDLLPEASFNTNLPFNNQGLYVRPGYVNCLLSPEFTTSSPSQSLGIGSLLYTDETIFSNKYVNEAFVEKTSGSPRIWYMNTTTGAISAGPTYCP